MAAIRAQNFSTELFISEVQKFEYLYNTKLKEYRDTRRKENIWTAIGKKFDLGMITCCSKWRSLRDRYAKELRKQGHRNRLTGRIHVSKWPFMKSLEFLRAHVVPRNTTTNNTTMNSILLDVSQTSKTHEGDRCCESPGLSDEPPAVGADIVQSLFQQCVKPLQNTQCNDDLDLSSRDHYEASVTNRSGSSATKRKSPGMDEQLLDVIQASNQLLLSQNSHKDDTEDEAYHFGMVIAKRLRSLSPKQMALAQLKIQEVLIEIEYGNTINLLK